MNCLLAFGCPVETQRYRICRAVFFAMHQTSGIRQMQEYLKAAKIDMQLKTHSSTGEIYGVTFSRNGVTLKGSQVDRRLSAANIQVYYAARWGRYPLRHCDELSDDKAINLVAGTLESIMSADTSTGQDEKRLIEARQHKMTIYR